MNEKEFLSLAAAGTTRVLMLLVTRRAQRIGHDVVGELKRAAAALDHLRQALRSLVDAHWAASLAEQGIEVLVQEIEPGDQVDRLGVALFVVPRDRARVSKALLKEMAQEIEDALLTVRRRSYERCSEGDLFVDQLDGEGPAWLTDEVVDAAIVPMVRLGRRHALHLQVGERVARALEVADVGETPAKFTRSVGVTGVIDGHSWSKREFTLLGSAEGEVLPSSLAGAQRVYTFTVSSEKRMGELLRLACGRQRQSFVLDEYVKVVDGGEVRREFVLRDGEQMTDFSGSREVTREIAAHKAK